MEDEEPVADYEDELEYDEQASVDESSASGSEFELSEEGSVAGSQDEDDITPDVKLRSFAQALEDEGIDADDVLMDFAVQESLQTARNDNSKASGHSSAGAGSSSVKKPRNAAAALRAAAAERRLSIAKKEPVVISDDEDFKLPEDENSAESDNSDDSIDEEPLSKKAKGKAKAVVRQQPKVMTVADIKRRRAEARQQTKERKAEERELRKKFGRKLTQVTSWQIHRSIALTYRHRLRRILLLSRSIIQSCGTSGAILNGKCRLPSPRRLTHLRD